MHLGTYLLHLSSRWGYGPVSTTDTGIHCDPHRSRRINNNPTLGTSSVCFSMQAWCHLVGCLGYQPDVGIVCWGSVHKTSSVDFRISRHRCLFFVAVCSAGNPAVFAARSTIGLIGGIVPFLLVALVLWLGWA